MRVRSILFSVVVLMSCVVVHAQQTIHVPAGGDLQAALNAAKYGDMIMLAAGASYKAPTDSPFILPAKTGGTDTPADYIIVRTSAVSELPIGRVSPADKVKMARIVASGPQGALTGARGAKWWKFIGIEFTNQSDGSQAQFCHTLIAFSGPQGGTEAPDNFGSNIVFDRGYIHSQEDGTTNYLRTAAHAIIWNAGSVTITNNYISGFVGVYAHSPSEKIDTVAIGSSASGGPFYVHNNYINADFNPIFLGGGENGSPNVATVAAGATAISATLSQVANLHVGDKIALEVDPPARDGSSRAQVGVLGRIDELDKQLFSRGATGDRYACGTILSISGTTITYTKLVRNEGGEQSVDSSRTPIAGGSAKWRGFTIHDFTFTRNTVDTDLAASQWVLERTGAKPKAYAEIKLLEGGLIEGNTFQGFWTGWVVTLRNQNGFSPWSNVKDLIIRNNLFKAFSAQIFQLFSGDRLSETGSNIQLKNNLMIGPIPNRIAGTFPVFMYTAFGSGIAAEHNTVLNIQDVPGGMMMIGLVATQGAVVKDNIMYFNRYGVQCSAPGNTFASCWPGFQEQGNIIVNNDNECQYITGANGNFPKSFCADASFSLTSDYRLPTNSPYKGKASDGTDPGVDMDQLLAALGGAIPQPTPNIPTPTPTPLPSPTVSPTPVASPVPTPTPVPGSREVGGYLKVDGDYFKERAIVTANHPSIIAQVFSTEPGGFFVFESIPAGSVLTAKGDGYVFGPVTVDSGPYFILTGRLAAEPTPTPTATPVSSPSPSPSPVVTPTPIPSPTVEPTPTPMPVQCSITAPALITVSRNGSTTITVTLTNLTSAVQVQVFGSDGQVTVTPLVLPVGPANPTRQFSVRVKRQSRTITFQSPCGSVSVRVNVT